MAVTSYRYSVFRSGAEQMYDVIAAAAFTPSANAKCEKLSVYLEAKQDGDEILEAANLLSCEESAAYNLSFQDTSTDFSGAPACPAWSYTSRAQRVTNSFDMTTNDRTWIFEPEAASAGEAWVEAPGVRISSTGSACHVTLSLSCPFGAAQKSDVSALLKNWYIPG